MKKSAFSILFLLLLIILFLDFFIHSSYRVLSISDNCQIGIDFNHNGKISDDELFSLQNIKNFCSDKDISYNEKFIGPLSEHEKLYFKIISKKYYEKIFLNSIIRFDNNIITTNFKNAESLILNEGLALPNNINDINNIDKFKTLNLKHKNNAKSKKIVLYNEKSLKYHKINCSNGLKSKKKSYIFKEDLPQKASPCHFCYIEQNFKKNIPYKRPKNDNYENVFSYGSLKIFIEHGIGVYKPSNRCQSEFCKILKKEIYNAKKSIDIAAYDLTGIPEIITALQNAKNRGVIIKVATDDNCTKNNNDTLSSIKSFADTFVYDDNPDKDSTKLMHNKFIIFDKQKILTGSANFTKTGLSGFNANNVIIINSKEISELYEKEFENFLNHKFHSAKKHINTPTILVNQTKVNAFFSPQDKVITNILIPEIQKAKEYIYIPIFIITHKNLTQELIKAKNRGVDVKVIIDATSARNKYSQHTVLRKNNILVKTENFAGKMHMKTLIIDDKKVFLGSMNFTKSGNSYNDENYLKIEDFKIAKDFKKIFLEIWAKIPDKYLHYDPPAESFESIGSCFDGIDNDYDGKIDNFDSSCKMSL